jgi:hypothetical protein
MTKFNLIDALDHVFGPGQVVVIDENTEFPGGEPTMLQVTIDLEALGEIPGQFHTFDVVSIGHYQGECIVTFADRRDQFGLFHAIETGSVFFKGLV